ncbi:MAG: hypothetical protein R3F14_44830 [Polyangiaceae bacterium]
MKNRVLGLACVVAAVGFGGLGACSAAGNSPASNDGGGGNGGNGTGNDVNVGGNEVVGSGGQTGGTITESCGASTFANQVPGSILVVLDKSGSMSDSSKWPATVDAIKAMMGLAGGDLGMGLLPFPEGKFDDSGIALCAFDPSSPQCAALYADGGCQDVASVPVVPVGPLSETQGPISGWLNSNSPGGNTPTLWALKRAYGYMAGADVPGERFVLLITDGEPTTYTPAMSIPGFMFPESNVECKQLADIEAEALAAANGTPKIKTFVIGSPGSEGADDFLSQLAINGETPKSPNCSAGAGDCHYQIGKANFQQELEAALGEITGKLSECVFEIPDGEDADPDYVNVELDVNGMKTQLAKDAAHADGWDYTDDSHTKVELFGPACEAFKAEKGAQVSIILGCKTVVK